MRAGEAARRAGVNAATLRYYERRGLLPEPARTPSGHRHYDEDASSWWTRFPAGPASAASAS